VRRVFGHRSPFRATTGSAGQVGKLRLEALDFGISEGQRVTGRLHGVFRSLHGRSRCSLASLSRLPSAIAMRSRGNRRADAHPSGPRTSIRDGSPRSRIGMRRL
jgi:hypothetical protein